MIRSHVLICGGTGCTSSGSAALAKKLTEELKAKGLLIAEWSADYVDAAKDRIGLAGSPTKVKNIQNVILTASEAKSVEPTDEGINNLMHELIADHTLG